MIANIFYLIFTVTITVLACFIQKKLKIVQGFVPMPSLEHHPRPPGGEGGLQPLSRPPVATAFGFCKNWCTHIFSVLSLVYMCYNITQNWIMGTILNLATYMIVKLKHQIWIILLHHFSYTSSRQLISNWILPKAG